MYNFYMINKYTSSINITDFSTISGSPLGTLFLVYFAADVYGFNANVYAS